MSDNPKSIYITETLISKSISGSTVYYGHHRDHRHQPSEQERYARVENVEVEWPRGKVQLRTQGEANLAKEDSVLTSILLQLFEVTSIL